MDGGRRVAVTVRAGLSSSEGRRFAFPVAAAFAVLGGLMWWRGYQLAATSLGGLALALGFLGLIVPTRLGPLRRGWMRLSHAISRITTPVVMFLLYFLVITPTALVMAAFGKRPLRRRPAATYWKPRPASARGSDLTRQF